jgi:hypothetical protein
LLCLKFEPVSSSLLRPLPSPASARHAKHAARHTMSTWLALMAKRSRRVQKTVETQVLLQMLLRISSHGHFFRLLFNPMCGLNVSAAPPRDQRSGVD